MEVVISQIMNAVLLGCTYTLIAIGFSLFFGVLDVVVFCSGNIAVFGIFAILGSYAIISQTALAALPMPLVLLCVAAISAVLCAALCVLTYYVSIKPFEGISTAMPLLSTIALGFIISEGLGLFFPKGRNPQGFPDLIGDSHIAGLSFLSTRNLFIVAVTVLILLFLFWFLNKTKMGNSMQAISQNRELATMCGINIKKTVLFTFMLGGVLLSLGGLLIGSYNGSIRFDAGSMFGIKGFSAAVVGGLRNIYGAVVGGMLLGFVEVFCSALGFTSYASVAAFIVVVLFIIFRPEGILGEKTVEKV